MIAHAPRRREDFPAFLIRRGLTGLGVEVGVWHGGFAEHFAEHWKGRKLYLVDPYLRECCVKTVWTELTEQTVFDAAREAAHRCMKRFGDAVEFIEKPSHTAAQHFEDDVLDWIYLDAAHTYQEVSSDLADWWPKLKAGGVFAGHDYYTGFANARGQPVQDQIHELISRAELVEIDFGVKKAVDEFVEAHTCWVQPGLTYEAKEDFRSWYFIKGVVD